MTTFQVRGVVFLSIILCFSVIFAARKLEKSSYFTIQSVEVSWLDKDFIPNPSTLDESEVRSLVKIPTGQISLFDLDVKASESRIRTHEWIRDTKVKRIFPNRIQVLIAPRQPKAIIQISKDVLRYVDSEGVIFGHPTLKSITNEPTLSGLTSSPQELKQAIYLLDRWAGSPVSKLASISSIYYDGDRGFRVLVAYDLKQGQNSVCRTIQCDNKFRAMIDLGQEIDGKIDHKLVQLSSVIKYLSDRAMPVRQIWAEVDKKIVVKTVHGS